MKLGVLLSMFPEPHETFILRELVELEQQGIDFEIFSLQKPRDPVTHPDAVRMQGRTVYAGLLGADSLMAFARAMLRHPLRMTGAVCTMAARCITRPMDLVKSLAIIPITMRFGRVMREHGITHLHGHWRNVPTTACWLLHRVEGFSWSAAIHGEDIFSPNPFLRCKLNAARFIAVCTGYSREYLRTRMGLERPQDVHLNYHGLDRLVWEFAADNPRRAHDENALGTILAVGRLFEFKGYDFLLRAVRVLVDQGLDVRLKIIGKGPREARLCALASELGINPRVEFLGLVEFEEVLRHMLAADVLCQASIYMKNDHFDGIPNVLAEAMALGLPVVSTRVSGIPELVEDGVSGLLVDEKDVEGLALALGRVLRDHELAAGLADAARQKVRQMFDQQRNVRELVEIFRQYVQ